jgi:predicted pyridoxine 5'-phosphate oxidase superfamily flavin-nucleotide-binding protein
MDISGAYHEGELAIQQRVDESEMARINASAIDKTILTGALRFIEQQPMVVIGSMDPAGKVGASTLFGNPGFIRALDNKTLALDISQPRSAADDLLWNNLLENPDVGLLVIELGSRHRIRINGRARKVSAERIIIDVEPAYPNCPKYIQRQDWNTQEATERHAATTSPYGNELNKIQKTLIRSANTLCVASAHPEHGVDASHRGGHPGFAHIMNNRQLRIPDFTGNSMFNTLGNFTSYPYAGLIFFVLEVILQGAACCNLTARLKICGIWMIHNRPIDLAKPVEHSVTGSSILPVGKNPHCHIVLPGSCWMSHHIFLN